MSRLPLSVRKKSAAKAEDGSAALVRRCRKIRRSDFHDRAAPDRLAFFRFVRFLFIRCRSRRGFLRPYSIHSPAICGNAAIVPEKHSTSFEGFFGPGVIMK